MTSPHPTTLSLVARDLSKSYGDRLIFDGVDVLASPGQRVGLGREDGVGKSPLLRLLAGLEPADSGRIAGPPGPTFLGQEPDFGPGLQISEVSAAALAPMH